MRSPVVNQGKLRENSGTLFLEADRRFVLQLVRRTVVELDTADGQLFFMPRDDCEWGRGGISIFLHRGRPVKEP